MSQNAFVNLSVFLTHYRPIIQLPFARSKWNMGGILPFWPQNGVSGLDIKSIAQIMWNYDCLVILSGSSVACHAESDKNIFGT